MAIIAPIWLKTFKPEWKAFEVGKSFTLDGKDFRTGENFDVSVATTRKLKQLYEHRYLIHDESREAAAVPVGKPKVVASTPPVIKAEAQPPLRPSPPVAAAAPVASAEVFPLTRKKMANGWYLYRGKKIVAGPMSGTKSSRMVKQDAAAA